MTTAKHPQGAAYNGTGALKLSGDEPRRNFVRRMPKQGPEEKRTKAAPAAQKPPAAPAEERKGENLLMSFLGGWSIRGAFLAIAVIAAVIIGTLISNAQLEPKPTLHMEERLLAGLSEEERRQLCSLLMRVYENIK